MTMRWKRSIADLSERVLCRSCGYDLRTITSSVCPECGAGFDPGDPRTLRIVGGYRPGRWRDRLRVSLPVACLVGVLHFIVSVICLLLAVLSWDSPGFADSFLEVLLLPLLIDIYPGAMIPISSILWGIAGLGMVTVIQVIWERWRER